jgi:hypothetical protein
LIDLLLLLTNMLTLILLAPLLLASALPLTSRATGETVQGSLGTDEYWNDYDGGLNNYTLYLGTGSTSSGWPSRLQWLSFNDMWTINQHIISRSCNNIYNTPNLSPSETQSLYNAIQSVAHTTRVDHRFILAIIMQETKGCVRASTTISPNGEVRNPGIMQDHDGSHSCNSDNKVSTPCPDDQILGMITDGVAGTANGLGLAGAIKSAAFTGVEFAEAYYRAARLYNSGVIDTSQDLNQGGGATHCYSSDVANRLVGWVDAPTACTLDD